MLLLQRGNVRHQVSDLLVSVTVNQSARHERAPAEKVLTPDIINRNKYLVASHERNGRSVAIAVVQVSFYAGVIFPRNAEYGIPSFNSGVRFE